MNSFNECKEIAELELDPIKVKLMHEESGEGWSREQADAVESEYRRFLYLMKFFPNEQVAPLAVVDIFWHYHILDTMKYAADCEEVFGYFLHHFPYVGLRADEEDHEAAATRMSVLYEETFGESYLLDGGVGEFTMVDATRSGGEAAYSVTVLQNALAPATAKMAFSIRVPQNAVTGTAGKAAFSIRVPQNVVAGTVGKTAFSIRVPQNAVAGKAAKTAFSIRVPQNAVAGKAGKTAFSIRVPQTAVAGSTSKTAFSIRVPQNAVAGNAGKTAFSIRVPQNAVASDAGKTAFTIRLPQNAVTGSAAKNAFSIRVPRNALPSNAKKTAFSIRVPQTATSTPAGNDAAADSGIFKLHRPSLAAA